MKPILFESLYEDICCLDEGLKDLKKQYLVTKKVPQDIFDLFVSKDPSKNKKYVAWLLKMYSKNPERPEHAADVVIHFDDAVNKKKIKKTDINQFSSVEELEKELEAATATTKTQQKKETKLKGATKVFEDDRMLILEIETHEASKLYGKGTKWCITGENPFYWNRYRYRDMCAFYFIIVKEKIETENATFPKGSKYAVQVYPERPEFRLWNPKFRLWNPEDKDISSIWNREIEYFEEDLGLPNGIFGPADTENIWQEGYDIWYEQTLAQVEDALVHIKKKDDYFWPKYDLGKGNFDKDVAGIAQEIMDKFAGNQDWMWDQNNPPDEGSNVDVDEIEEYLYDKGMIVDPEEAKNEEWLEQWRRRDLPGQKKFSFAERKQ